MIFKTLQSGSNGNCILIGNEDSHVLIDAGISCKKIKLALMEEGLTLSDIGGICITHEHSDHIVGLMTLMKNYDIPLFAAKGTIECLKKHLSDLQLPEERFHVVEPLETFSVGSLLLKAIRTSHDAADPVAYRVFDGEKSAAVMTDLGCYTEEHVAFLKGVNVLLLEANHEIRMLEMGPYPFSLKRRILSDKGHISNETSGKLLVKILHPELKKILLGHLSEENNLPEIALMAVKNEIDLSDTPYQAADFQIETASRYAPGELIRF